MTVANEVRLIGNQIRDWSSAFGFRSADDIPRIPRPSKDWVPPIHPEEIIKINDERILLDKQLSAIDISEADISTQVDYFVLKAQLKRFDWDINVLKNWQNNAEFLISQILGPFYDLMLPLPNWSDEVQQGLVTIAKGIPDRLKIARESLIDHGVKNLGYVALGNLENIGFRYQSVISALETQLDVKYFEQLQAGALEVADSLESFRDWLIDACPKFKDSEPVGRENFVWFLRNVALISEEPEELVRAAMQDYRRSVVAEILTKNRFRNIPIAPIATDSNVQSVLQKNQEAEVRAFLETEGLLTQPDTLKKYHVTEMPEYLAPLHFLGMADDLTDETSLDRDGVAYFPAPNPDLPYFYAANARDPRLGIIHEGAHYKQLALSAANENPIRRRYVDSCANEGIAFYNEEMMLLAGLFEDAPHSQEVVHNFNRLRSLRVVVDVNLATGKFSLQEAIDFFVKLVPMDQGTAAEECALYIATPGLAMSYHVGKMAMQRMITDAVVQKGAAFSLLDIHNYSWRNGNLPFALQRYEYLGDSSDLDQLGAI